MSSSEDDFYSDPVKKLAKFNDVESADEDDLEIKENVPTSFSSLAKIASKHKERSSKDLIKNADLEILEDIKKPVGRKNRSKKSVIVEDDLEIVENRGRPRTRSKRLKIDDEDFEILENTCLSNRRRSTNRTPSRKRARTRQQNRISKPLKSPKPRKGRKQNSSIIILSDDEVIAPTNNTEEIVSNVNLEHRIKIWWQCCELKEFKIRKYQKLQTIFDFYAEREKIALNRLVFFLNNKTILPTDTPDSLNLEPIHIIEGGWIDEEVTNIRSGESNNNKSSTIQLKVQLRDRKKPLHVCIKKTEPLSVLMAKCTEELECAINKLRFEFDGDLLNPTDTPESLDFDGGECIDVFVKNS